MGKKDKEKTIYDNYAHDSCRDMFGDKADYEKHARNALPILIERAKKGDPIDYHKLREMLGIPYYNRSSQYIGNYVCACISTSLFKWEQNANKKLPRLTNIVSSQSSFGGNNFVFKGLKEVLGETPNWKDYKRELLAPIHAYDHWDEVLNTIYEICD